MDHKFASLIHLKSLCDQFTNVDVLSIVDVLLKNSKHGAKTVISGLFRQLYLEGESNDLELFQLLNTTAQELIDKHENDPNKLQKDNVFKISDLPDSLLGNIASYLSIKDILKLDVIGKFCNMYHGIYMKTKQELKNIPQNSKWIVAFQN